MNKTLSEELTTELDKVYNLLPLSFSGGLSHKSVARRSKMWFILETEMKIKENIPDIVAFHLIDAFDSNWLTLGDINPETTLKNIATLQAQLPLIKEHFDNRFMVCLQSILDQVESFCLDKERVAKNDISFSWVLVKWVEHDKLNRDCFNPYRDIPGTAKLKAVYSTEKKTSFSKSSISTDLSINNDTWADISLQRLHTRLTNLTKRLRGEDSLPTYETVGSRKLFLDYLDKLPTPLDLERVIAELSIFHLLISCYNRELTKGPVEITTLASIVKDNLEFFMDFLIQDIGGVEGREIYYRTDSAIRELVLVADGKTELLYHTLLLNQAYSYVYKK